MSVRGNALAESGQASAPVSRGALGWAERGWVADLLLRRAIRGLCARRLKEEWAGGVEEQSARFHSRIELLRCSPLAIHTDAANAQHYELPPAFFQNCLGARLKYSCAYYPRGTETLNEAEDAMLGLYGQRAGLSDGQRVLELGCGWGSLTLWMAQRYPHSSIDAVSNSKGQREFIEGQCRERGISNVRVIVQDVNRLQLEADRYDRCVSVEMFEHMRNYDTLLRNISTWLRPNGRLFVHIFVHRTLMYPFETQGDDNWMGRFFFTGGLMPSAGTLLWFQNDLQLERQWMVDGTHYERTANHWLQNHDANKAAIMRVLAQAYGSQNAALWSQRWRMFWMACAELFGYANGREWLVAHYRFARRS
jgi:cyclopropane-fatty-acyl-phospholipid synthase